MKRFNWYKFLNTDIKDFNFFFLSFFCFIFLFFVGCISFFANNSYSLFSDIVVGNKTIETEVCFEPNSPLITDNMIPVYFDDENNVWRKADVSNKNYNWYDYCNKKWANSVTVSEINNSRDDLVNSDVGTEIPMSRILTMQVWIPRYKYKVWNYNGDGLQSSVPQEIKIIWEKGDSKTGDITCIDNIQGESGDGTSEICKVDNKVCVDGVCNGKTYTHPAFTFGGEELTGFWVGKFELSVLNNEDCYLTSNITNCNKEGVDVITKPDVLSYRHALPSLYEFNIFRMKDLSNIYGFSDNVDTHMIKNSEWGAVVYLSHSKYGTCTSGNCAEVTINNSSSYITGRSAGVPGSSSVSASSEGTYTYEKENGVKASTTLNVYGIYDMSGGTYEYVMGNMVSKDGVSMMTGYSANSYSGYAGVVYDDGSYSNVNGLYSYPNSKYYDKYSFGSEKNDLSRSKLGDGIKENFNGFYLWYSDLSYMVSSTGSWFNRGGAYVSRGNAGAFSSSLFYGTSGSNATTRFVIS